MKVCILTHTFPRNKRDVAAAFMKGFSDGLVQAGNSVVVVAPFDSQFRRRGDKFDIVTYKYIWPDSLHILGYSQTMEADVALRKRAYFLLPFMVFFGTLALFKTIREKKIDIINVHWILPNGVMAFIVSKITGVPFAITLPGTDAYLAHRHKAFGWVAKIVAQNAAGIISNSSWHLNRILALGVKDKSTDIISYPTDVSAFKPISVGLKRLRKKHGLKVSNLVILAIGRLVYKKGFNYLIRAVAKVVRKYPHVRLLIGGDGDLRQEWEDLSAKLGVKDKVLFIGTIDRDEIVYYYNLADVMVASSIVDKRGNVDGGPVVSFESMACGKPQVVTNVLGVADIITDNVNGFVVSQKDSGAIANALEKLIKSENLREKMGKANRKLIKNELDTKKVGEKYTKFFEKIVSSWVPTPTFLYRNYLYERIVKTLSPGSYFLDVGAGNGEFLKKLLRLGFRGEAIDISKKAVVFGKRQLAETVGIEVKLADIFTYRPKKKYDVVFCFEVLEHIEKDEIAMRKIYRLLKKGGVFVMSVPAHMREWAQVDKIKGHYRRYERDELVKKLQKAGFDIKTVWTYGFPFLWSLRRISRTGKFIKSSTLGQGKDKRGQESSIQQEYNPKLRFIVENKALLWPLFQIMNLFLNTDLGLGYIVVAKKSTR